MEDLHYTKDKVALIFNDNQLTLIQTESIRPYPQLSFEEAIQKMVDELNKSLEQQQYFEDIKAKYINGDITDEQLAELVTQGKLTQAQADEIKEGKK